jgi:hypothetical protein
MAKQRSMNELRQEKTYGYRAPFGMTHEEEKPKGYTEIDIDTTKELIVKHLSNELYDTIFQAVNDEMAKHEVFQEETYFTPQGIEEFNEAWYEFYHNHFGDIMNSIKTSWL